MEQNHKHVMTLRVEVDVLPTVFHSAGEILNAGNGAVVLPLRFVQLHSSPEASRELSVATEPQGPNLRAWNMAETQIAQR